MNMPLGYGHNLKDGETERCKVVKIESLFTIGLLLLEQFLHWKRPAPSFFSKVQFLHCNGALLPFHNVPNRFLQHAFLLSRCTVNIVLARSSNNMATLSRGLSQKLATDVHYVVRSNHSPVSRRKY